MTQSAVAFKDTDNGYEQRSDGLWVHSGSLQVAPGWRSPGGQRLAAVLSANGRTDGATDYGLQITNASRTRNNLLVRDDGLVTVDQLAVNQGIPTSAIQPNAVQQQIGSTVVATPWSTVTTSAWVQIAPSRTTFTTAGGLLRIEYVVGLQHSTNLGQWQLGLGWDDVVGLAMGFGVIPAAGLVLDMSGIFYLTLGAGPHSVGLFVNNLVAGTLSLYTGHNVHLYVTEQKR